MFSCLLWSIGTSGLLACTHTSFHFLPGAVEERAQQVHPAYMLHPPLVGRKDKTVRKENRESATYTVYGKYCKAVLYM